MRRELLEYLACPVCGDTLDADLPPRGIDIATTDIRCAGCGTDYPVVDGVPRMNEGMKKLESVARTFGYEWKAHHSGTFEAETLFGRTREEDWRFFLECMGITEADVRGKTVLDAGCGSGRFTELAAEHGARVAIGVDINEAVEDAYRHCGELANAHIVQGNIMALPFRRKAFDLVWCSGVIHHTPDARAAHSHLSKYVKSGGTLYVWVYAKRFNPFRFTKTLLDAVRVTKLPEPLLLRLAKAMAYPSIGLLAAYRAARTLPPLQPHTAWGQRTMRPRSLREVQLTWFDALSPEYDSRHSEAEVIEWFEREGFTHIVAVEEPKVGVRGIAS